jgi:hypothetical protein
LHAALSRHILQVVPLLLLLPCAWALLRLMVALVTSRDLLLVLALVTS